MLKNILDMVSITEFYGISENIEIAKGKYKIPKRIKDVIEQSKREVALKRKLNGKV
jgi:hypothetical protein